MTWQAALLQEEEKQSGGDEKEVGLFLGGGLNRIKTFKNGAQPMRACKVITVLNLWPTNAAILSYCLWQCFPLMKLHGKHQGSILHTVAGFQ